MHLLKSLCCAAAIALLVAPGARADEWNKKTYLTFSGPVQIPGTTLPAGTYLFQLADPDNARHVIMVASKDGTHVFGMFITIPNDRLKTPDENVVMFGETPAGAPQAVQAWWYPGDRTGEEFVYPKTQAVAIAKANHREVLATDSNVNANASESERMASLRGSNVGRVDENGNMKNEPPATNTAESVSRNADRNRPAATTTAPSATTTADQSAKAAPSNTVDGRDASTSNRMKSNAKSAVGTSGQTARNTTANDTARKSRKQLPRTASSLSLFELLSALSLAAGLSVRQLRRRTANAR